MRRLSTLLSVAAISLAFACSPETGGPKADAPVTTAATEQQQPEAPPAEQLPDGAELLSAHVAAAGGAEQIAKIESVHTKGTLAVDSHNLKGTSELWWQKDGKFYLEQTIEGIGKSRVGYDGETIWLEDPITGLRKLQGAEAAGYLQSSLIFLGHDWPKLFSAANTKGKQKLDDAELWEIELVSKGGPNVTIGLDVESKMIRQIKTMQPSLLGETPFEVRSDKYEAVGGYKFPTHNTIAVSGLLELDETITQTEVNVTIDPAMFAFPTKREVVPVDPKLQPAVVPPGKPADDDSGK